MSDATMRWRIAGLVAGIVFGCATVAAVILFTWIVAQDAARSEERQAQRQQIIKLMVDTAVSERAVGKHTNDIEVLTLRMQKLEKELAVSLDRTSRKEK